MGDLTGKVAFVTGAGTREGLGRAISLRLARDEADIVVTDLEPASRYYGGATAPVVPKEQWQLDNLVEEIRMIGRNAFAITADLSDREQAREVAEKALDKFGSIDILVNNAGLTGSAVGRRPVVEYDEIVWTKQLDINVTAAFVLSRCVAKRMIEKGRGGKIINVSTVHAKTAVWGAAGYSASKSALIALTRTLALELAPYKINVNAVCPGYTLTWGGRGPGIRKAMNEGLSVEEAVNKAYSDVLPSIPLGRLGKAEEIANLVAFLASSESDYITGQAINIDGGVLM